MVFKAVYNKFCCPSLYVGNPEETANKTDLTTSEEITPVECKYESNPTSSDLLCDLWCEISLHKGSKCIKCPEKYINDIQGDLICDIWFQLEDLKHKIDTEATVTTPLSSNTSCKYADHSTSSDLLCEVWCQIEELKGSNCVFCPQEYQLDFESETLCQLWEDLIDHQNSPESTTAANPTNVACKFESNITSGEKLCDLWCQIQLFSGSICCPAQYIGNPEEDVLCKLWSELQNLETVNGSETNNSEPLMPIECTYLENSTSSDLLCKLWCNIQNHKGFKCIECPEQYTNDSEGSLLCELWSELEMLRYDLETLNEPPTTNSPQNITCKYSLHKTSSKLLCDIWCQIQELKEKDILCPLWESLVDLQNMDDFTTLANPQHVACPYDDHETAATDICDLWCQVIRKKFYFVIFGTCIMYLCKQYI